MPDIIHLLPDALANQIAAGEVVQRPASVVKELMENSIDAKASTITLIVKEAGKAWIQVLDDGVGMSATDARMSLERHATSKIKSSDDLFALRTMGFRGEALASIAAVSQTEIKTREHDEELGTQILVEGSDIVRQEPVACEAGCSITVKNLFYNIPARRQFLKSNAREWEHIQETFIRIALAYPHLSFHCWADDEHVWNLPATKLHQRITTLLGKNYQQQLLACQGETGWIRVTGYIGKPASARKMRGHQYFYINQRYIKSSSLHFAVMQAYENLLPEKSYPFYVLLIDIDPSKIDVNVHPAKTEIKFDDERSVFAFLQGIVRQALNVHHQTPSIDFELDVNMMDKFILQPSMHVETIRDEQWGAPPKLSFDTPHTIEKPLPMFQKNIESRLHDAPPVATQSVVFQWQKKYIITALHDSLYIIHQQRAHTRILYDRFVKRFDTRGNSQQLLFPQTITLSASDFALVEEMQEALSALGFQLELFGKNAWLLTGIPLELAGNEHQAIEQLLDQFKQNQALLQLPIRENLVRSLAGRAAVKEGQSLGTKEMEAIIAGLFSSAQHQFAPDGSQIFYVVKENYLLRVLEK